MMTTTTTNSSDLTLTLPRKLTEPEQTTLKTHLTKCYKNSCADTANIDEEDMTDILDYTLTMIQNGKSVGYVTGELEAICDNARLLQGLKDGLMEFVEGIIAASHGVAGNEERTTMGIQQIQIGVLGMIRRRMTMMIMTLLKQQQQRQFRPLNHSELVKTTTITNHHHQQQQRLV